MRITEFIRQQPATVDRCAAAVADLRIDWPAPADRIAPAESIGSADGIAPADSIALVGSGSSFNALVVARPRFVACRRGPVVVHEPQDFIAELAAGSARPLVAVLSQSGASVTSIAAARAAVAAGLTVVALTASADSPLAGTGARVIPMPIGAEPVGPKTKGFAGSVVMLDGLARALGAPPAVPAAGGADLAPLIEPAAQWAAAYSATMDDVDQIVLAGRSSRFGIALEASLKIAEISGVPAAAFPTEELLHGRLHGMTSRSIAFVLARGEAERQEAAGIAAAMRRRGCRVVPSGVPGRGAAAKGAAAGGEAARDEAAGGEGIAEALRLLVPFQWLAVRLAEARGLVPETMRHGALSAELAIKASEAVG